MSNKKQLLTESEIRRFMKLANLEPITDKVIQENYFEEAMGDDEGMEDSMPEPAGSEMDAGAEEPAASEPDDETGGGSKEDAVMDLVAALKKLVPDLDIEAEKSGSEPEGSDEVDLDMDDSESDDMSDDSEEDSGESEEEDSEEEGEEDEEEAEAEYELQQEALVNRVLQRVTARLISESAKKDKKDKADKKETVAQRMKRLKKEKDSKKKKKIEEANAPAPKATSSNGPKKGAGSANKGTFGVTSPLRQDDSFQKGTSKRGDKMQDVTPSSNHTTTHGKKNLATMGGNKKK